MYVFLLLMYFMSTFIIMIFVNTLAIPVFCPGAASPDQVTENATLVEVSDSLNDKLKKMTEPVKQFLGNNCDLWADVSRIK